ncbi:hypothetical protein [Pseudonocardia sp. DLS-67]
MVESVRTRYAGLFEVRVLHHYWLDDGEVAFDAIPDQAVRARRLRDYDVRRFLAVEPGPATAAAIAGLRGVFRTSGLGFLVAVPDDAVVAPDARFEFFLTVTAPDFSVYTAQTLRPHPVVEVTDPATRAVHRYKADVPVLTNLTGAARGSRLFLSREYPGTAKAVEDIVLSDDELRQATGDATGDPPTPPFRVLGPKDDHPVYVHQADAPPIVPPAGATGAPARGVALTPGAPPTVAAVVRLAARRGDAFGLVRADGTPRTPAPVFEIHFQNRWTTWRYRKRSDGSVTSTEAAPRPLTHFVGAGTKRRPSTAAITVEFDGTEPAKVARLVSEIHT